MEFGIKWVTDSNGNQCIHRHITEEELKQDFPQLGDVAILFKRFGLQSIWLNINRREKIQIIKEAGYV